MGRVSPHAVPQQSEEQKLTKSIHCCEERKPEPSTALVPQRLSPPGAEGTPSAPARLIARGPPAEQGTEADKIISILWGYEPEQSTALLSQSPSLPGVEGISFPRA